jgi:hypothetical protein
MKDLSDYIIYDAEDDAFYVDATEIETWGERLWEDGEKFQFEYEGCVYVGSAVLSPDGFEEVSLVTLHRVDGVQI